MDELILHCKNVLRLIDEEYPNKGWAVNKLYQAVREILEKAENNVIETKDVHYLSLGRCFADETTDCCSPILSEFALVKKTLKNLQSKP